MKIPEAEQKRFNILTNNLARADSTLLKFERKHLQFLVKHNFPHPFHAQRVEEQTHIVEVIRDQVRIKMFLLGVS